MTQDNEQECQLDILKSKLDILKSVFMTLDDVSQEHALSVLKALRFGQEKNIVTITKSPDESS